MGVHRRAADHQVPSQTRPALNAPPILAILASYLLGATPTSYIAGKVGRGIDLREHGSKNLGATNVYRILGWKYAIPVALVDIAKGAVPVLVFWRPAWLAGAVGAAAVLGHMFSPYVSFTGGKGVATAAGMFLALAPIQTLLALVVFAVVLLSSGYVSLGSLTSGLMLPVLLGLTVGVRSPVFAISAVVAAFVFWTHRANIARLRSGEEHRFGKRGAPA